jgi:hypothetical protein
MEKKVLCFELDLPEDIARTISDDTDVGQEVSKKETIYPGCQEKGLW